MECAGAKILGVHLEGRYMDNNLEKNGPPIPFTILSRGP